MRSSSIRQHSFLLALTASVAGSACHQGIPIEEEPLVSDSGVVIPAGQALAHPLKLEPGVILTGGAWVHDGGDAFEPGNYAYQPPGTLDEALELPAGSIFVGDVIIPAGVALDPGEILPGGRVLDATDADTTEEVPAILVPPNAPLSADANAVVAASLLSGALPRLAADLPVPAGSTFPNGTMTPDGEIISEALPEAFDGVMATEATTLAADTWLLGGVQLPDEEGILIDAPINAFVGSIRIPDATMIPAPGIGLPAGTRLDSGVLIPRGATFLIDSTLPTATELGLGYLEPPTQSPPELVMSGAQTLGAETTLPMGTALLGEALIPAGVGELTAPLFLPGGSLVGRDLALPEQEVLGMVIPPTGRLATAQFSPSNLPAETLMLGYPDVTAQDITLPTGTQVYSGYQLPDGSYVEPGTLDTDTTLPAGSVLFGGADLPESGAFLTFSAPMVLPGAAMVPSGMLQNPNGLTIPTKSQSVSGTTGAMPADMDFGQVLTAELHMPPGSLYCKSADITDASGFAKITTATIEYQIDGMAQTQIDIATDFQFTNIIQTFTPSVTSGWVVQEVTGLDPETTYYFRVSLAGCGGATSVIQGFRTTNDPCGGEFELVSPGDVYDGWDGRFGTAAESALHVAQMKINPNDGRLYIAASKQSDGTANLYRSSADFLGIEEAGLVVGNAAVRNSTTIGFQNFTDDYVYLAFKDNANRGFSFYRWVLGQFGNADSVASADGVLGGINAADSEGFGESANEWATDSIGAQLGVGNLMYVSTRTTGRLYMADAMSPNAASQPGDALDFTDCPAGCGNNLGAGFVWESGTNNIGAMEYVDAGSTSGLFLGIGTEGGSGATLAFMPTSDLGSLTPNITTLTIAGLSAEVVSDIKALNDDLVFSASAPGGGQAWICRGYATTDCSAGANWALYVDFADGTGLTATDAANIAVRWVRQMPNSGVVYLGTENATGAQIWSAADTSAALAPEPQTACGGLGDGVLIAAPTAETMHNPTRNVDILYFALHQYGLYDQANAAPNNVYVYRRLEAL